MLYTVYILIHKLTQVHKHTTLLYCALIHSTSVFAVGTTKRPHSSRYSTYYRSFMDGVYCFEFV